jgi:hypothetical protein
MRGAAMTGYWEIANAANIPRTHAALTSALMLAIAAGDAALSVKIGDALASHRRASEWQTPLERIRKELRP